MFESDVRETVFWGIIVIALLTALVIGIIGTVTIIESEINEHCITEEFIPGGNIVYCT